jgi:hypothetical protein
MRRFRLIGAALLGSAVLAFAPAAAVAAISPVVSDCQKHNGLEGHYTTRQLQAALKSMPPTIAEYSNCQQVIMDQLHRQLGTSLKGGGSKPGASSSGGSSSTLVIVIVVVVVLIVAGGGFLFWQRRAGGGDSEEPPPPSA